MGKIHSKNSFGLGQGSEQQAIFSRNHFAGAYPAVLQDQIQRMGLSRVAGNVFECPSDKNFWAVKGGKIIKLVGNELDTGQSIQAAPEDKPAQFLAHILDDLSF